MSRRAKTGKTASVDLRQVERLADLSRLSLDLQETERLRGELSSILGYFATLDKVDISRIATAAAGPQEGGLRDDAVRPSSPDEILQGVPQRKGRYVRAPRVF